MTDLQTLDIARLDWSLQFRPLDEETVTDYYAVLERGDELPPFAVAYDRSTNTHYVTDGFHRLNAHIKNGATKITATVVEQSKKAARWAALGANAKHGKRLSSKDIEAAIAVADSEFPGVSARTLAEHLGCSHSTVLKYRNTTWSPRPPDEENPAEDSESVQEVERVLGRDGKFYPKQKEQKVQEEEQQPKDEPKPQDEPKKVDQCETVDDVTTGKAESLSKAIRDQLKANESSAASPVPTSTDNNGIIEERWFGDCQVILGNSFEVMEHLEVTADAIISDPPYGITNHTWDVKLPLVLMWQLLIAICKPAANFVMFGCGKFSIRLAYSKLAWYRGDLVWHKNKLGNRLNGKILAMRAHENILVFGRPGTKKAATFNFKGLKRRPTTVLPFKNDAPNGHETHKPVALMEELIRRYTNPGDLVIDPFAGSGTTALACLLQGRRCIAIEREPKFFEIMCQRLEQAHREKQDNAAPVASDEGDTGAVTQSGTNVPLDDHVATTASSVAREDVTAQPVTSV